MCLTSPDYPRNEFIFNFAFVLSDPNTIDVSSYKSVATKLARLFRGLEEQSRFLSEDTSPPNSGKIFGLCEMLMEDLNNYCECMIPIDGLNTLNIKLFPTLPHPASVKSWHVPLFTVRIETLVDENWDLTMQRIIPFINGVNSVKQIASLADADIKLTRKCVKNLVYYGCVLLLDIFSFNAIYAPTAEFTGMIARDQEMQKECARYVNMAFAPGRMEEAIYDGPDRRGSVSTVSGGERPNNPNVEDEIWPLTGQGQVVDGVCIVQLFSNLQQGLTVREWYAQNTNLLANIDLRRFVTFGVIKGFLYRVHRYAFRSKAPRSATLDGGQISSTQGDRNLARTLSSDTSRVTESVRGDDVSSLHPSSISVMSSLENKLQGASVVPSRTESSAILSTNSARRGSENKPPKIPEARLSKFLDGTHCFDEICTELGVSEKELIERLKRKDMGEVHIICR